MTLEQAHSVAEIVESVATTIGIFAAGIWTYLLFVKRRHRFPRAAVSHRIDVIPLDGGRNLLRIAAKIVNTGEVLVCASRARTRVQQVCPVPDHIAEMIRTADDPVSAGEQELPWPVLCAREWRFDRRDAEVEPGESEVLHSDIVVPALVRRVLVYTYVSNQQTKQREIGWSDTEVVEIVEGESVMPQPERAPQQDPRREERQLPPRREPDRPPTILPQLPPRNDPPPPPRKSGDD